MSYSSLLTSSSVDLFDRTIPKESIKEKAVKWFPYVWKALVFAILCGLLFLVCYDIHRRQVKNEVTKGIKCYECTAHTGMNITEPGIPYEEKCITSPRNIRRCASGEVCTYGTVKRQGMKRYIRQCTGRPEKSLDCVDRVKPFQFNFCYCESDLCNK